MAYTTKATSKGGREGRANLDGGALALSMSFPKELGGAGDGHIRSSSSRWAIRPASTKR